MGHYARRALTPEFPPRPRTLTWRWAGKGPVFRKIGKSVRYDAADIDAFIEAGKRTSTSDPGPQAA
jgi:hypothetical protein